MARVFVTGATGCLGHRLTLDLLAKGHEVTALIRDEAAAETIRQAGAHLLKGDIRQGITPQDLQGIDQLHHCAALSSAWGRADDFRQINVHATAMLLDQARKAGVGTFLFASSPSIYADGTDRIHVTEDAPLPAHMPSPYARSKFEAEQLVLQADDPQAMRCISLRPRAVYGRGDRSLLPRLLAAIRRGRVPMIEGGRALIDLTHVSDAAQAFVLAGQSRSGGRAYNITSGEVYRLDQIIDIICQRAGQAPRRVDISYAKAMAIAKTLEAVHRVFAPAREPALSRQVVSSLGRSLTLDITAAVTDLGYVPRMPLSQGIEDYADVW